MHNHCKSRICIDLDLSCSNCHFFDAENARGGGSPHQNAIDEKKKRIEKAAPELLEALITCYNELRAKTKVGESEEALTKAEDAMTNAEQAIAKAEKAE